LSATVLRRDVLARWDVVLQLGVVTEREGNTLFGELQDLGVGVVSGRPAVNVGRLGPPAVCLVVIDDACDLQRTASRRFAFIEGIDSRSATLSTEADCLIH
jgi:hypothetical protein